MNNLLLDHSFELRNQKTNYISKQDSGLGSVLRSCGFRHGSPKSTHTHTSPSSTMPFTTNYDFFQFLSRYYVVSRPFLPLSLFQCSFITQSTLPLIPPSSISFLSFSFQAKIMEFLAYSFFFLFSSNALFFRPFSLLPSLPHSEITLQSFQLQSPLKKNFLHCFFFHFSSAPLPNFALCSTSHPLQATVHPRLRRITNAQLSLIWRYFTDFLGPTSSFHNYSTLWS